MLNDMKNTALQNLPVENQRRHERFTVKTVQPRIQISLLPTRKASYFCSETRGCYLFISEGVKV